jgi:integrase
MMSDTRSKLTDALVRGLPAPASGAKITYDAGPEAIRGFGIRVTAAGARSFVLNYVVAGRERRMTIGSYPAWKVAVARKEAGRLKKKAEDGIDPLGLEQAQRAAPTVRELCDRYLDEHAVKKRTSAGDRSMIERVIKKRLGSHKVASITYTDIDRLHRDVSKGMGGARPAPYQANRLLSLLSKMFSLSIRWGMRADNPAKGVERNQEQPRHRYLSGDELRRLTEALAAHSSPTAANAVRLLLLTGARRGEVLGATWDQFDLTEGVWTKPSSHTKQNREHRVPLSAPARQLLAEMLRDAGERAAEKHRNVSPYLFQARAPGDGPMTEIKKSWAALCKAAKIDGVRIHDLRHSYASMLASAGLSLPIIGALLGHTQPGTTARYAHLFDNPLRAATERVGAIVTGKGGGGGEDDGEKVVSIERGGRR